MWYVDNILFLLEMKYYRNILELTSSSHYK